MLKSISRKLYQIVYHTDIYDQPEKFVSLVQEYLTDNGQDGRILDAACGFNNVYLSRLVSSNQIKAEDLLGLDIDNSVISRNCIHRQIIIQDLHQPIQVSFNVRAVICINAWEHLHSPSLVLQNFYDVMDDEGILIIIATQRYYYISIIERILPRYLKDFAWKLLKGKDRMPYPTYFRFCSKSTLKKEAEKRGFQMIEFQSFESAPLWFTRIPPLFLLACLWMSLVNRVSIFENVRGRFIAVFVKR